MAWVKTEPFPLNGGRAGLGVFAPSVTTETLMGAGARLRPLPQPRGHTPTQPSPIEGEGYVFRPRSPVCDRLLSGGAA
jgi:hypothetical protein